MNSDSLLAQLDNSIEMFAHLKTPDPASIAAFDALKQARALVARALAHLPLRVIDETERKAA